MCLMPDALECNASTVVLRSVDILLPWCTFGITAHSASDLGTDSDITDRGEGDGDSVPGGDSSDDVPGGRNMTKETVATGGIVMTWETNSETEGAVASRVPYRGIMVKGLELIASSC